MYRLALLALTGVALALPRPAEAQLWKQVRDRAAQRVIEKKMEAETKAVTKTGEVVDSSLAPASRGADTAMAKAGAAADTGMNAAERGVTGAVKGLGGFARGLRGGGGAKDAATLRKELATGRTMLTALEFKKGGDKLDKKADAALKELAGALLAETGVFLIESHTADAKNATENHALAHRRSGAVKARLVELGVPATRLLAVGIASGNKPAKDVPATRIEIARPK